MINKQKIVECLQELADKTFQEKVWRASGGPVISSITEAACGLFDDSGLDTALEKGHTVFSREIDEMLRQLGKTIQSIDEFQPPDTLLNDPKMFAVRQLAADIISLLKNFDKL